MFHTIEFHSNPTYYAEIHPHGQNLSNPSVKLIVNESDMNLVVAVYVAKLISQENKELQSVGWTREMVYGEKLKVCRAELIEGKMMTLVGTMQLVNLLQYSDIKLFLRAKGKSTTLWVWQSSSSKRKFTTENAEPNKKAKVAPKSTSVKNGFEQTINENSTGIQATNIEGMNLHSTNTHINGNNNLPIILQRTETVLPNEAPLRLTFNNLAFKNYPLPYRLLEFTDHFEVVANLCSHIKKFQFKVVDNLLAIRLEFADCPDSYDGSLIHGDWWSDTEVEIRFNVTVINAVLVSNVNKSLRIVKVFKASYNDNWHSK